MIPEVTIQKILDDTDIVKVISEYVKLEKKSSNYVGLCPFHPDQNPSMHVSPTKKIYKCFSCGAGGNVINFVQNYERISYREAIVKVAEKSGIDLGISEQKVGENLSKYYKILDATTNFYQFLLKNTKPGLDAIKYLEKRNIDDDIINKFKIGFAMDEVNLLFKTLEKEEFQPLDMIEAGVIRGGDSYTDFFRNRIIFPLDDINGRTIGFSGRLISDNKEFGPKYLNSFENKVFKKSDVLYNFSSALNYIRQENKVYIFEGFLDVIAAHRVGIYNAVAIMGTATSKSQINSLKKITDNFVICFDGDNPGIEASKKVILQLLNEEVNTTAVLFPDGLDPDDYLNKFGQDKFTKLLNNAVNSYDFIFNAEKLNLNLEDFNSVENFKNKIFSFLNHFDSSSLTEMFIQKLASTLNISVESVQRDYQKVEKKYFETKHEEEFFPPFGETEATFTRKIATKYEKASKELVFLAYNSKENCERVKSKLEHLQVSSLRNINSLLNSLFAQIILFYDNNEEMEDSFQDNLSLEEKDLLANLLEDNSSLSFQTVHDNYLFELAKAVGDFYKDENVERVKEEAKASFDEKSKLKKAMELQKLKQKQTKIVKKE